METSQSEWYILFLKCKFEKLIILFSEFSSNEYGLLVEFVDEAQVEEMSISSWDGSSESHRFPKAGLLLLY